MLFILLYNTIIVYIFNYNKCTITLKNICTYLNSFSFTISLPFIVCLDIKNFKIVIFIEANALNYTSS